MDLSLRKVEVQLTEDSTGVLEGVDPIHRNSAVNLGLSLLSKTSIYKNFYLNSKNRKLLEESKVVDSSVDDLSSIKFEDSTVATDSSPKEAPQVSSSQSTNTDTTPEPVVNTSPAPDWETF